MARYTGPVCRICRREGTKLFLKAERCYSKCPMNKKRNYPPGQHGQLRKKVSEYGLQLREKQKTRRTYGILEGQFRTYFDRAARHQGVTGTMLLQTLERRLDNAVYRAGFGGSRPESRQLVRHGHFLVNGKKVNIPSYLLKPGDKVSVAPNSQVMLRFKDLAELNKVRVTPEWLSVIWNVFEFAMLRLPERAEIDTPVQEHLIVELYSR